MVNIGHRVQNCKLPTDNNYPIYVQHQTKKYNVCITYTHTLCGLVQIHQHDVINFYGPGRAISPVCVCVCVCECGQ